MYYTGMSKEEIRNSSLPFLYGLYKVYVKRACENLGVSPDKDNNQENENEKTDNDDYSQYDQELEKEEEYPENFGKLLPSRLLRQDKYDSTSDFLKQFPSASMFHNAALRVDKKGKEEQ